MSYRILIVDDSIGDRTLVAEAMRTRGMRCAEATTLKDALRAARVSSPDLVILDLGMPDGDGRTVIEHLAENGFPVLICSGDPREKTRVGCLAAGADDYVLKPFSPAELAIRAERLAKKHASEQQIIRLPRLTVDVAQRQVRLDGRAVHLPPKEFDLMVALARRNGAPADRNSLLQEVWPEAPRPGLGNVTEHMRRLRNRLNTPGRRPIILSSRGTGYLLDGSG